MERISRIKLFITAAYYAIVTIEILAMFAVIALIYTGDMMYFVVCCINSMGVLVLHETLKAAARQNDDWFQAYWEALNERPLPGRAYHLFRAAVSRRRLQRSG